MWLQERLLWWQGFLDVKSFIISYTNRIFETLNRASGITVSPGTNSRDMVVVSISLGGTPGFGVSIDLRASEVGDFHEVEGEDASRSRSRAIIGDAAGTADIVKVLDLSFSIHFWHCLYVYFWI